MAVFTAIATAIVGAIGITGTLATIATSFIAAGLAIGTAKILGVMDVPKGQDPGVKIQLPPATDNKVPRLYGRNYTGGTIIDAEIKNQNKTMAYCVVLSEMSDIYAETWTVNSIYRGDNQLFFGAGIRPYEVTYAVDPNGTTTNKIDKKIRVRVYAGGSGSAKQIFPVTFTPDNAYGGTDTGKTCQFLNWTASNTMTDLVFAIIEIDYDAENDLVGLGAFTFDIQTSLGYPSACLVDYLNNERYGMGNVNFPVSIAGNVVIPHNIDTNDLNEWTTYSATNNVFINGGLSTFDSIRTNVNKICMSGGALFTYNNKTGKFGITVNRAASNAELANAFVLSDDNLVGAINVTSTDLFSMYNQMEVEFPSIIQKDQTDTVFLEVDSSLRNANEPDNKLNTRFDLTNDRQVAINLANIDLRQGRYTTVVSAKGDFSTTSIDTGDVVKLTNTVYGFNEKLFRVVQTREVETEDSMLFNELTLLEYNANVYTWTTEAPSSNIDYSGISNWWNFNSNSVITLGNVAIVRDPRANAVFFNPASNTYTGIENTVANVISDYDVNFMNQPFMSIPVNVPNNVTFNSIILNVRNTTTSPNTSVANSTLTTVFNPPAGQSYFQPGTTVYVTRPITDLNANVDAACADPYAFDISMEDTISGSRSRTTTFTGVAADSFNFVDRGQLSKFSAGTQVDESGLVSPSPIPSSTTFNPVVESTVYNLTGTDYIGQFYRIDAEGIPTGDYAANTSYDIGIAARANIMFSNGSATANVLFNTSNTTTTVNSKLTQISDTTTISLDPAIVMVSGLPGANNVASDMYPVEANIWIDGYSNLANTSTPRTFYNASYGMFKITKSIEP
jgi:hypothetical protein